MLWDPLAEFVKTELPNGLQIHASRWPRSFQVVGVLIHSGSECDPQGKEGAAHFVEHAVNQNGLWPHEEAKEFADRHGGHFMFGATSMSSTLYSFFLPADEKVVARGLEILGAMLLTAKLEKKIEHERKIILDEYERSFPPPKDLSYGLDERKHRVCCAGMPLASHWTPLGTTESIRQMSQHDLQSFYDKHYVPANMSIVALGGLPVEKMTRLVRESLFCLSLPGSRNPLPQARMPSPLIETRHVVELQRYFEKSENGSFTSSCMLPAFPNRFAIPIALYMLEHLLHEEARTKRGWTYGVRVGRANFRYASLLTIKAESISREGLAGIETLMTECIDNARTNTDLFERYKNRQMKGQLLIDAPGETIAEDALHFLDYYQRIVPVHDLLEEYENLKIDDARQVFDAMENRWTCLQIP